MNDPAMQSPFYAERLPDCKQIVRPRNEGRLQEQLAANPCPILGQQLRRSLRTRELPQSPLASQGTFTSYASAIPYRRQGLL